MHLRHLWCIYSLFLINFGLMILVSIIRYHILEFFMKSFEHGHGPPHQIPLFCLSWSSYKIDEFNEDSLRWSFCHLSLLRKPIIVSRMNPLSIHQRRRTDDQSYGRFSIKQLITEGRQERWQHVSIYCASRAPRELPLNVTTTVKLEASISPSSFIMEFVANHTGIFLETIKKKKIIKLTWLLWFLQKF